MDAFSELTADDFAARQAARRSVREHADRVALAAARTAEHGFALLERSRARQTRAMKPWLLPVGALVRVSYLHAPTVRQQLKSQLVRAMSPSYTQEVYRITARRLAPRSTRVMLYDAVCAENVAEGDQAATTVGAYRVQLPLELSDVDRRHLQPVAAAAHASTARAHAGMRLVDRLSPLPAADDDSPYVDGSDDDASR